MARFNSSLDQVSIAAPCSADWDRMFGNDRVRFCSQCNLNVYKLSELSRRDAESFVARNEGRLCVRFYRRRDGSILTRNCPIGLRALKRKFSCIGRAAASAILTFLAGVGLYEVSTSQKPWQPVMGSIAIEPPQIPPQVPQRVEMGEMAFIPELPAETPPRRRLQN